MKEPLRIMNVYRFQNDMVMVFDQYGQQMPEYQGSWEEVKDKIEKARVAVKVAELDWRDRR